MNMDLSDLPPRSATKFHHSKYDSRESQPSAMTYNNDYQAPSRNGTRIASNKRTVRRNEDPKSQLVSAAVENASTPHATPQKKAVDYTEELTDFIYVLTPVGQILYASNGTKELLNYAEDEIVGHNVMEFIHPEDVEDYVQAFNDSITHRVNFHNYHRFRKQDGNGLILETTGHAIFDDVELATDPQGHAVPVCKCFVLTARPYPSPAVSALDDFLELKLEFELLKKELRDLGETEVNLDEISVPEDILKRQFGARFSTAKQMMPKNLAMDTIQSTIEHTSFAQPQIQPRETADAQEKEKVSQATESKHIHQHPIALHDRDYTSDDFPEHTPTLDEAVIDFAKRKKSKKLRAGQIEHKCTDCGRTESPEWRKGVHGPKTLCNACGLRYSKRQKKVAALSLALSTPNDAAYATSSGGGGRSQSSDSGHDNALATPTGAFSTLHRGPFAPDAMQFYPPALFMDELSDSSHLTSPMMHDPSYPPPADLRHLDSNGSTSSTLMNSMGYPVWQ